MDLSVETGVSRESRAPKWPIFFCEFEPLDQEWKSLIISDGQEPETPCNNRQSQIDFIKKMESLSVWRLPECKSQGPSDDDDDDEREQEQMDSSLNEDSDLDGAPVKRRKLTLDQLREDQLKRYKHEREKLENDQLRLSAPINTRSSDGEWLSKKQQEELLLQKFKALKDMKFERIFHHCCFYPSNYRESKAYWNSVKKEDHENVQKIFNLNLKLAESNFFPIDANLTLERKESNSFPDDSKPDLQEEILQILRSHDLKEDDITANLWLIEKFSFRRRILELRSMYDAVKLLYMHFPYVQCNTKLTEVEQMVDLKSAPFITCDFAQLMKVYRDQLQRSELQFHPLIRKSYKTEFCSRVDLEAKSAERNFIMTEWRHRSLDRKDFLQRLPLANKDFLHKLSQADGLRDKEYEDRCQQIRWQEVFDYCLDLCQNVTHDSCMEDLICEEHFIPEELKDLHPELFQLSLQAYLRIRKHNEEATQCLEKLQLLEDERRKMGHNHILKMLVNLHTDFPYIVDFPLDKPVDSALEERFKGVICKIKETYLPEIADYYVAEAVLIYMKHLSLKSEDASWPTTYSQSRFLKGFHQCGTCHEHPIYDEVMNVEYKLA